MRLYFLLNFAVLNVSSVFLVFDQHVAWLAGLVVLIFYCNGCVRSKRAANPHRSEE